MNFLKIYGLCTVWFRICMFLWIQPVWKSAESCRHKINQAESSWKKCVTGICGYGNQLYASGFFISRWTDADRGNLGSDSALFHRGRTFRVWDRLYGRTDPRGSKSGKSSFTCAGDRSGRTWNFIAGVAAGSENRQQEFIGAANEAQIAAVKLKEAKQPLQNFNFYFRRETGISGK